MQSVQQVTEPLFVEPVIAAARVDSEPAQSALVYLGRQPILEHSGALHGYELLFRASSENHAVIKSNFEATAYVVARTFGEFGLADAIGPHLGYLNFSRDLLFSDIVHLIPRKRFVLEILEDTVFDAELIRRCADLRRAGFRLAMDDVAAWTPELVEAIRHVDLVKVDFLACDRTRLPKLAGLLKRERKTMLAEKIETRADFDLAKLLGFDLFQGYFFARPQVLRTRSTGPAQRCVLNMLIALSREADIPEIERALKQSPQLMMRVLRFANSTAYGASRRIASIREAIIAVGTRKIARWVQLLVYADGSSLSPEADPLFQLVGTRARLMELLAGEFGAAADVNASVDAAFMAGVLSLAHVILDMPTPKLCGELGLAQPLRDALVDRQGTLGEMLKIVEAVERGDPDAIAAGCEALGRLTPARVSALSMRATAWTDVL
jgi:EAL and modified HD-GYP domain-containing signal transduction protein